MTSHMSRLHQFISDVGRSKNTLSPLLIAFYLPLDYKLKFTNWAGSYEKARSWRCSVCSSQITKQALYNITEPPKTSARTRPEEVYFGKVST